jgi:HlyD family secretion protein
MKTKRWMVLALVLVLMVGCGREPARVEPSATPIPDAATAATASPSPAPVRTGVTILADGVVQAVQPPLSLAFETGGKLLAVHVQAGDRVQAGDLVATLDDTALQEAVTSAGQQVAQSENNLAQAQLVLDDLLAWEPNETAVALAEANLAAAQAGLEQAQSQEAVASNNLTSVHVQIAQAQRAVDDAQEAYDKAHNSARDWELNVPWRSEYLKAERKATTRGLQQAQEALSVAYAQYNLAATGLNDEAALLNAQISIISAQQAVEQATTGPKESEIAAARLRVEQARLSLEGSLFHQQQAENALARAQLLAPGSGTVLSVDVPVGAMVGAGTPIVTLLDVDRLEFYTTNLSERDLAQVFPGQTAVVTLKTYPDDAIKAVVVRIGLQVGPAIGDAATFPVVLVLSETDLDIRPGMTGRAEIRSEE